MSTFAVSLTFTVTAKDLDKAHELAEKIGTYVQQEDILKCSGYAVIDVEEDSFDDDLELEDDEY